MTGNESTVYHVEVEADAGKNGGDVRPDYFIAFNPSNNDVSVNWRSANLTDIIVHRDADNTVGGNNLTAPDNGDPNGYEGDVSFNEDTEVFGRINNGDVEIAIKRSVLGLDADDLISTRGTTRQDSNISKDKLFYHDRNTDTDLSSNRIDNTGFVSLENDQPDFTIVKTGDTFGKATDDANFTVTIVNTGAVDLHAQSIADSLVGTLAAGDFAESAMNNNILEVGESWTLNYSYTVLSSDPDQLTNTVTAIFDTEAGLSGDEVTRNDSHAVDLFAPAVQIVKTANKTSAAVGEQVTYTFTITNLTDGDLNTVAIDGAAPDLILSSIIDDVLGDLSAQATTAGLNELSVGESGFFTVDYMVLGGDPDPLVNTVSVLYNPEGFPNQITDTDDHSLDVITRDLIVTKSGDQFSKVGDGAAYVVTIFNSGDVNLYPQSITDSLVGALAAADFAESSANDNILEVGETWTLNYARVVQAGDPDQLVNTVTAVFDTAATLDGIEVTHADSHTVDLFTPSVQITKTADKVAAVVGQTVKYTFTITNLTDGDPSTVVLDGAAPDLILSSLADTVLGDLSTLAALAGLDELALGESGSFDVDYVVQASDPSPLVNTVMALYNPEGFPNQITDSDSHTLYVVDASFSLTPGTATNGIGETHTFTATVTVVGGVIADGGATVNGGIDSGPGSLSGLPGTTNGAGTGTGVYQFHARVQRRRHDDSISIL